MAKRGRKPFIEIATDEEKRWLMTNPLDVFMRIYDLSFDRVLEDLRIPKSRLKNWLYGHTRPNLYDTRTLANYMRHISGEEIDETQLYHPNTLRRDWWHWKQNQPEFITSNGWGSIDHKRPRGFVEPDSDRRAWMRANPVISILEDEGLPAAYVINLLKVKQPIFSQWCSGLLLPALPYFQQMVDIVNSVVYPHGVEIDLDDLLVRWDSWLDSFPDPQVARLRKQGRFRLSLDSRNTMRTGFHFFVQMRRKSTRPGERNALSKL